MSEHITFRTGSQSNTPDPIPASQHLPDWFRMLELAIDSLPIPGDKTAKLCMPLNDAMKMGWLLRAPCDIYMRKRGTGIEITADIDGAATEVHGEQTDSTRNSSFLLPECIVSSNCRIESPAGYATLVTQPLNRDELRFTVPGMLVPTDEYDGGIGVPMYVEDEEIFLEAGEPIAQVIPVAREDLSLDLTVDGFEPDSKHETMLHKTLRASTRRKDVYRKDAWVPKPSPQVREEVDDSTADRTDSDDGHGCQLDSQCGGAEETENPGQKGLAYYCSAEQYGTLPAPVPARECVSDQYLTRLRSADGLDSSQPTSQWIEAATAIGAVVPLPARTTIRRTGGNQPLDVTTETDDDVSHKVQFAEKMGEVHPLAPAGIINITTEWLVRPPSGYSVLVCSPFGHLQRYYRSYAGLADFDRYATTANTPGLFTERADEWTLPAQTPVSQHVPIDRDKIISVATIER